MTDPHIQAAFDEVVGTMYNARCRLVQQDIETNDIMFVDVPYMAKRIIGAWLASVGPTNDERMAKAIRALESA